MPEAAVVGAASGAFASNETPTLAPLESSATFLDAYQRRRGRSFTSEELQVAWAASLWPAIHNARAEYRFDLPPVAGGPLEHQSLARLAGSHARVAPRGVGLQPASDDWEGLMEFLVESVWKTRRATAIRQRTRQNYQRRTPASTSKESPLLERVDD
jgi:hypothetical protein